MPSVLDFNNVTFGYSREPVLENVNLSISSRDFIAVIGPNGGGKTTLLKLALGLLEPNLGTVTLLGNSPYQSRTLVGYTPQYLQVDPSFPLSVMDVVLMGRLRKKSGWWYSREDRAAAQETLHTMQLFEYRNAPFGSLSGGQKQRTLIARALCGNPEILFLDEPTNNIDPSSESILYKILERLNERLTILIVSHDVGVVSSIVKNVICVNRTVAVHPASQLTGLLLHDIYGSEQLFVRHDHRCTVSETPVQEIPQERPR
ncbi:MAG: ABC transporter ATP-binding protein [Planctomycetaceae bacterium]|jgi:zinc transport system ATP-binding protein|nr:ABC transporter ATP-binding protein [Planctomycetaceae bacterium]